MIYLLLILFGCTALAYLSPKTEYDCGEAQTTRGLGWRISFESIAFILLVAIMVCFSGLRTVSNDTSSYLSHFEKDIPTGISSLSTIDWALGANPLFGIYQILLKTFVSNNGQVLIFTSAFITVTSTLVFIRKYSENFALSVYLFISFTVYAFSLAAIKQTMATAIAIWAIPLFLKNKKIKAIVLLICAMLIHPYVAVYFTAFFFSKSIWDKKTTLILLVTSILIFLFSSFATGTISLVSLIGDEYDYSWFENTGVSIFRVLFYVITPALSFAFRDKIREKNDRFTYICVNLSLISLCIMILATFGGANLFGRVANYFDILTCVTLPTILNCGFSNRNEKRMVLLFIYVAFFIFYLKYYSKTYYDFFGFLFVDGYQHVSFLTLFRG